MKKDLLALLRPYQWVKNLFIFAPLFFGKQFTNVNGFVSCLIAFVSFSLVASAIYCLNDIKDIEADRHHPTKCTRPLAAGRISKRTGMILFFSCITIAGIIQFFFFFKTLFPIILLTLTYLILNIAYCFKLKQIAILDVIIVSSGFVIRVFIGGEACSIIISHWLILMTFLLTLFMAVAKRRDDIVLMETKQIIVRKTSAKYNKTFLDVIITIITSITIICYIMYCTSREVIERLNSDHIYMTSVFVIAGIMRYLQITLVEEKSGDPTNILHKDTFIQLCIAGWGIFFLFLIYF